MSASIEQHPFIFSDQPKWRIRRHAAFWSFWWLFQGFLYSFVAAGRGIEYWERLESSMVESLIFLIPHVFLSYSIIYYVIPRFLLKQQYLKTAVCIAVLFLITAVISVVLSLTVIDYVREVTITDYRKIPVYKDNIIVAFMALMAGFRGSITIGGMAGCIKLMKHWYMKERRNLQLQKQNAESQLQLLKAQVHPHFLFNTLNNIYSYTHQTSPAAANLVTGLSDMLRYMLYETNQPLVPLRKELKLLEDYISIERIRYGNKLDVHIEVDGNIEGLYIAPLLLIPFVENCFKHGASRMIDSPWISLHITIGSDNAMYMKLVNGKPEDLDIVTANKGIGIENVRKRLQLVYAFQYKLDIINDSNVFVVNLKLQLDKKKQRLQHRNIRKVAAAYV
jgi:sensor histidine kinase YesM